MSKSNLYIPHNKFLSETNKKLTMLCVRLREFLDPTEITRQYNVRHPLKDLSSEEFVLGVDPVIKISLSD